MCNKNIVILILLLLNFRGYAQSNHTLKPIAYDNIILGGELADRAKKNYRRLESDIYSPKKVFSIEKKSISAEWPGDIEGRLMLGLILESQATHQTSEGLKEMIDRIPKVINTKGYFGPIQQDTIVEQQLSGNGWFLRALCEYYQWKKDPVIKMYIRRVIKNLALPTKGYHMVYPIDLVYRKKNVGAASGTTQSAIGKWKLSSDVGCDFIFLDGIVQAYAIIPSLELKQLIDEMIQRFSQIPLDAINAQTHATLTAVRAIIRYYAITHNSNLLGVAKNRYKLYKTNAMTANFENFNWFGRPEWTEPCAIVDSYIAAVQLWQFTGDYQYLEDAHHIYYNALSTTQHENGGFGLSNCTIPGQNSLKVIENEAWWCCTMRGAEGLANATRYNYFYNSNTLALPFFNSSEATFDATSQLFKLRQTSYYPFKGEVSIEVLESKRLKPLLIKLFSPSWTRNHRITKNGKNVAFKSEGGFISFEIKLVKGDILLLSFDQIYNRNLMVNQMYSKPDFYTFNYGPLVLGYEIGSNPEISFGKVPELTRKSDSLWLVQGTDIRLSPVYHLMNPQVSKDSNYSKQILFKITN